MNQAKKKRSKQKNQDRFRQMNKNSSEFINDQKEESYAQQSVPSQNSRSFRSRKKEESQDQCVTNSNIVMDSESSNDNEQSIIPQTNNFQNDESMQFRRVQKKQVGEWDYFVEPRVNNYNDQSFVRRPIQNDIKNEQFRNKKKESKVEQSHSEYSNSDIQIDDSNPEIYDLELDKKLKESQIDINNPINQINSELYERQHPISNFHQIQQNIFQQLKNETKTRINFEFNSLNQRNIKELKFLEIQLNTYCAECTFLINDYPLQININNNFQMTSFDQRGELTCKKCKHITQMVFEQKQLSIKLQAFNQQIVLGSLILSKYLKVHNSKNIFDIQLMKLEITCDCGKRNKYRIELSQSQIMNKYTWQRFCDDCWKMMFLGFKNVSFRAVEYEE